MPCSILPVDYQYLCSIEDVSNDGVILRIGEVTVYLTYTFVQKIVTMYKAVVENGVSNRMKVSLSP